MDWQANAEVLDATVLFLLLINIRFMLYFKYIMGSCQQVLNKERFSHMFQKLLFTEVLEVNIFAFAYRLFHEDFSPICDSRINLNYMNLVFCIYLQSCFKRISYSLE